MDYNETLCQAIDIIIAQRISEVNFDRTILCTITDDSKKDKGEYTVTDGSVTFQAFAETDRFYKNNQVYVEIPMGDFSNRKLIIGRHTTEDDEKPLAYVSPMESIVPMQVLRGAESRVSLVANQDIDDKENLIESLTKESLFTPSASIDYPTTPYNAFYIKADFMCLLQDMLVTSGSYGIKVVLHTKNGDTIALDLDCQKDMFGNPYGYTAYSTQSQTYSLKLESDVVEVEAYAYQDNNFYYYDGVSTKPVPVNQQTDNIIIKNIELGFAYDVTKVDDNTVKISTADELTYNNITDTKVSKELVLTWYNKDENNRYLGFTDGEFGTLDQANEADSEIYYIRWQHSLNNGQWEDIQTTGEETKLSVTLNMTWATNEYRAIVIFNGRSYTSNTITFKNATGLDDPQGELKMSLALHNVENSSYDSYPLYGPDGIIINPLDSSKRREVYFSYDSEAGGSLEPNVLNGGRAYFYIPENSTMLELPTSVNETNWNDERDKEYQKVGYTAYVKEYVDEFSTYDDKELNLLKNTAPKELICKGANYNYTNRISDWSPDLEATKVQARSTNGAKKAIMLQEKELTEGALRAVQQVSLQPDKEYTFSSQAYSNTGNKPVTLGIKFVDKEGNETTIGLASKNTVANEWVKLSKSFVFSKDDSHFKDKGIDWDNIKTTYMYLTTTVLDSYTLFYQTYLRIATGENEKLWMPASGEYSEVLESAKTFSYCIKKNYNPLFTNNTVVLKIVDKNGFVYETSKTFNFSSYGTSGTDYCIIISGANGENGWVSQNGFTPKAQLYDANYKEITGINWVWSKYPTGIAINAGQSLSSATTLYQVIKAQTTVSWVGKNVQISGIYPISYSSNEDYMYQGPVTVIYNSNGVKPSYYDGNLGIFKKSDNSEIACTWSIEYFTKSNKDVSGDKEPWLSWGELTDTKDGHTRFKPSSMYLGDTYYLVLVAKSGTTILWRQPLIILQNQYASGLLNNWDGNLIVDNENNYILSSMMGAGSKDSQNRFSGVLMGEVSKVADNAAETGLFGYHEGAQSFGFRTDGTAFIGKSGAGRIEFDGSKGVIQSAKYGELNASGSKWDLANGSIILNGSGGEYFKFNEKNDGKLEMKISGANIILEDNQTLNSSISAQISASADHITSTISDNYYNKTEINQTVNSITSTVTNLGGKISFYCTCDTSAGAAKKYINLPENSGFPAMTNGKFPTGTSMNVRFSKGNTNKSIMLTINGPTGDENGIPVYLSGLSNNAPVLSANDSITFIYDGEFHNGVWVISDNGTSSQIIQTANSINASVLHKNGTNTGTGFGWNLTDSEWKVGAINNNVLTPTLTVNKDGLKVKGEIEATKLIISNDAASNAGIATKSYVEGKGYVDSSGVKTIITPDYIKTNLLEVEAAKVKGPLTAANIVADKITAGTNNNAVEFTNITASGGKVGGWSIYNNSLGILTTRGSNYYGIIFDNYAFTNASRAFAIGKIGYGLKTDQYQTADKYQQALLKGETDWGTPNFQITYDGIVTANYIIANGGQIGDFTIKRQALPSVDTYDAKTYTCLYGSYIEPSAGGTDDTTMYTYITPQGVYIYDTYLESWRFRSWWRIVGNY